MSNPRICLIHPPVAKPSEPPAGVARLAGALQSHGVTCSVVDANLEGLLKIVRQDHNGRDTWSMRARRHLDRHLSALRSAETYRHPDRYRRAVADINRLLELAGQRQSIRIGLANYADQTLSPVRSDHLIRAAQNPDRNPFFTYYQQELIPRLTTTCPDIVGLSINYLSQALCAFALIGMLRTALPESQIAIGGGLVTSWSRRIDLLKCFHGLVDRVVPGPGESALLQSAGINISQGHALPVYQDLLGHAYLSPGWVLPYSASSGCWWRKCAFCPERVEQQAYHPLPRSTVVDQLRKLCRATNPAMIHLLDNALSPALLKTMADHPPGAPWYGFVRIAPPLDDLHFCRQLAASGCAMLKIGLETGDPKVLEAMDKGADLATASQVLHNLKRAGIATYVYLLFGTPAEDETSALKTLSYIATHAESIDFLNLAIFNLPVGSHQADDLELRDFYPGDLALYSDFSHPKGWNRAKVRRFVEKKFKKHPQIQPIIRRDPPIFTSNHAPFLKHQQIL
ncbi:MAG: radical SAM protein [Desulfobacteraceae bacterium]